MPVANKDVLQELSDLMKDWEGIQNSAENDPTPILIKFCELFERETTNFLKQDPDPFDDRHPVTSKPDCALGQCLRSLFRRNTFVTKLVTHYVKEDYFSLLGTTRNAMELNTTACRLILNLTYGMDIPEVFRESESQVTKLFEWAESGPEPLRSYATGLLASAMDVPELASAFKDQTAHLMPIMLLRLKELKEEGASQDQETGSIANHSRHEDSFLNSDCSNSSWAEMGRDIVGTFEMHPPSKETKEIFILRFLRPISEYQEALPFIYQHSAIDLVLHYINVRKTNHSRLSYEALRFLGSLLFHKKFCVEFVSAREANTLDTGVHKLLQVPRPSLPADGVALCLWYLAYCEEAVEKICQMPEPLVSKLVSYSLWLMECSHQSSQMHAIMFFGMVFKFRTILDQFDAGDGLRRIMNILTTLPMLRGYDEDGDIIDDSNEVLIWQIVKQVFLALHSYFEAHLFIKSIEMHRSGWFNQVNTPYKAINRSQEMVESHIEYLRENLPARPRWEPIEQFVALKGHEIIIRLLARMMADAYSSNQDETVIVGLECLYTCSVLPLVQSVLCEKMKIRTVPEDLFETLNESQYHEVPGYSVLMDCLHESSPCGPEIQKSALEVLVNCCCAPIYKPFRGSLTTSSSGYSPRIVRRVNPTNEDVLKRSWDCVRTSNGIMNLVSTVKKKIPVSEIDGIRALACRVLCGLVRSDKARQIISKLQLFTNGELQLLMKEPVLPDKIMEHVKFQKYALELTQTVSGINKPKNGGSSDVSMFNIRKADVVSKTRISYNKRQLLQLIQKYLDQEGFQTLASDLQAEASLSKIPPHAVALMGPPSGRISTPSPPLRMRFKANMTPKQSSPLSRVSSPQLNSPVISSTLQSTPSTTNGIPPIQLRINKSTKNNVIAKCGQIQEISTSVHLSKEDHPMSCIAKSQPSSSEPSMTLDKIVIEYLSNQHSLCKHPVVTCPTFDLFEPHRCPEPKPFKYNPMNFTLRHMRHPYDKRNIRDMSRRFIYSKYRLAHTLKSVELSEFVCACYMTDDLIAVGTVKGDAKLYNKITDNLIASHTCFGESITSIYTKHNNNLVLVSSAILNETSLWSVIDVFDNKGYFSEGYANFVESDKILTTTDHRAKIYDLNTKQMVAEYAPKYSNHYESNRADVDPSFDLLLTDGILFDIKSGKEIHKFDKMNEVINGKFHMNGLEIVSSSEIWDLRTFHLLRSAPVLSNCDIEFNGAGDIIFAVDTSNDEDLNAYETSFKVVDASNYTSIVTFDTRRKIFSFSVNSKDTQIALVERDSAAPDFDKTAVRLYDIGMIKDEDEETIDDDDDDDDDEEDDDMATGDSSDSDDQNDDRNSESQFDDELEVLSLYGSNSEAEDQIDQDNTDDSADWEDEEVIEDD